MLEKKVNEYKDEMYEVFKQLHQIPESGMKEKKTTAYLKEKMEAAGVFDEIYALDPTGLVGVIRGKEEGPTIAIRGDIDALEFGKEGESYCRHACGHDAHATMALMAAIVAGKEGLKRGTLKVILQPAEELLTGARLVVDSGYIDDVDEIYGGHLRPIQEAKMGQATPALLHAASQVIKVEIQGKEAHGARPHLGINAIDGAAAVINAINAIHLNPAANYSVKCTQIQGGGAATNVIPGLCKLTLDVRAEFNDDMDQLLEKIKQAVEAGAQSVGAEGKIVFQLGVPAAEYDPACVETVKKAIEAVLGEAIDPIRTPGGEDFHVYHTLAGKKTAYFGLGADLKPGLHAENMEFNHKALENGLAIYLNILEQKLM